MSLQNAKNLKNARLLFFKPGLFFQKVKSRLSGLGGRFFIDKDTRAFIRHNRNVWKGCAPASAEKIILTDFHNLTDVHVAVFYFLNVLARRKSARIISFGRHNFWWARCVHAVYRSANVRGHLVIGCLNSKQKDRAERLSGDVIRSIRSKNDVFNIVVDDIHIGIDIYETYLREFNRPTVLIDKELFAVIRWAVTLLVFWQDYLKDHDVAAVVLSHDSYVDYDVIAKIAYSKNIPVYMPNFFTVTYARRPHSVTSRFKSYQAWFDELDEVEQRRGIELARNQLEKRFSGRTDGVMLYRPLNAFQLPEQEGRVLKASDRTKVMICSHCFFDNPHAYGGMIFPDFYEWLKFLANMARKTDYDWYLKTHPAPLPGTLEIIHDIIADAPITVIPPKTSPQQLVREGLDAVLTVYGTVGHEYPAFGVQVLNAGYNPHAAFDFTWTPKDLAEYEQYILDLPRMKKDIDKEDVYRFYFMHHYFCWKDDLVYDSYRQVADVFTPKERTTSAVYSYFLKQWTPEKHERIIRTFGEFIDSGKQHLFKNGPVDEITPHVREYGYLS